MPGGLEIDPLGWGMRGLILAGLALLAASPAGAVDKVPCPVGNVCASKPETVAHALQEAGFKGKLETDSEGDPSISSAAGGYKFDIYFSGCELHAMCDALQFSVGFDKAPGYTEALANDWNKNQRFGKAFIDDKGAFWMRYDVTTMAGGVSEKNFADIIDWYQDRLSELRKFFDKKIPTKK